MIDLILWLVNTTAQLVGIPLTLFEDGSTAGLIKGCIIALWGCGDGGNTWLMH